jgi:hypothetical protein
MKRFYLILAVSIPALQLLSQVSSVPITPVFRVALMDFMSEDNSYRSTVGLADMVSALQVEASRDTNFDWVERAELDKAMYELKLAGFGLVDRSEAIRGGRLVHADWGIFGDVSTNFNGSRLLSMEIVNLKNADVLAETNLFLSGQDNGPFQMKIENVPCVASALKTLLVQAREVCVDNEKKDAVAFLFLSQSGIGDTYDGLEDSLRDSLLTESTNKGNFHLIQFQRAGAAMDEANLVLGGLAESDSNAWQKVADHYVWGDYHFFEGKTFDWQTKQWNDENTLDIKLNVWDGRGEPQTIVLSFTNVASEAVAGQMVKAIDPLFRKDETKPIVENARNRISDSIFAQYDGLPVNFQFDTLEGRRQWFDAVQLLETACFFNPGNAAAREQLLRLRWGTALPGFNASSPAANEEFKRLSLTGYLIEASRNEFFFARRRSDAWEKYVEQFGFNSALPKTNSPSIATEYVLSAWRPFDMFSFAQENQARWGVPRDAGLRELDDWQNQFGSEFISRVEKAPDQYSDTFLYTLQNYYKEIGQPGGESNLLAQLKSPETDKSTKPANTQPAQQKIHLPRIAELGSLQINDIFSTRPMAFLPSLIEPDIRTISFPAGIQIRGVKSMIFHDGLLWLTIEIAEPIEIKTVNSQIEKEFQAVTVDHTRLWKLMAGASQPEPVTGPLATNDINSMIFHGDTLWLALNDQGIAALNVKTGELRRYESSEGIVSTNQYALADTTRGIVAIGGLDDFTILENGSDSWKPFFPPIAHQNSSFCGEYRKIAGQGQKLLYYNSKLLLCDLESNSWTRVADPAALKRIGQIDDLSSDMAGNFWIASSSGLHNLKPDTGKIRSLWTSSPPTVKATERWPNPGLASRKTDSQLVGEIQKVLQLRQRFLAARKTDTNQPNLFVQASRLPSGVSSVAEDGDFLWVFTKDSTRPLLYHSASQSWVGGYSIRQLGTPSAETCGSGKLWLATQPGDYFLILEIDTGRLKSTPREQWLPDIVSENELSGCVSDMSEKERAVYLFFSGKDEAIIKLLEARPENELDPESLFLLVSALSETRQTAQAGHYENILAENFPGNIFTTLISKDQRLGEDQQKNK